MRLCLIYEYNQTLTKENIMKHEMKWKIKYETAEMKCEQWTKKENEVAVHKRLSERPCSSVG